MKNKIILGNREISTTDEHILIETQSKEVHEYKAMYIDKKDMIALKDAILRIIEEEYNVKFE